MKNIFVHGLGQTSSSWNKTISSLDSSINSLTPDLPRLLNNKEVTYESLYKVFSEYLNDFDEPLNLCGLSLGGILVLNYAIDNPSKVNSLTLIGAQYKMPKNLLNFQSCIFKLMPKSTFKDLGFSKDDFIKLTKSMMDLDFSNNLQDIKCSTLVLCGDKDGVNKKASQGLANSIPNSKLIFIEGAKHEVNIDSSDKLPSLLMDFYKEKIIAT